MQQYIKIKYKGKDYKVEPDGLIVTNDRNHTSTGYWVGKVDHRITTKDGTPIAKWLDDGTITDLNDNPIGVWYRSMSGQEFTSMLSGGKTIALLNYGGKSYQVRGSGVILDSSGNDTGLLAIEDGNIWDKHKKKIIAKWYKDGRVTDINGNTIGHWYGPTAYTYTNNGQTYYLGQDKQFYDVNNNPTGVYLMNGKITDSSGTPIPGWSISGQRVMSAICDGNHLSLCTTQSTCEGAGGDWHNERCYSVLHAACDAGHLSLCTAQADCVGAGGYWYNNSCHATPPAAVCDGSHLNLCTSQSTCEGAGGYWYNGICNSVPQATTGGGSTGNNTSTNTSDIDNQISSLKDQISSLKDTIKNLGSQNPGTSDLIKQMKAIKDQIKTLTAKKYDLASTGGIGTTGGSTGGTSGSGMGNTGGNVTPPPPVPFFEKYKWPLIAGGAGLLILLMVMMKKR